MAVRADRSFTVCTLGYSDPPPTARGELPDDQARRRTERTHRIFLGDHLTGTRGASSVNECNGDLSPVETIAGGLDYFRLADHPGFKSPQGRLMQCLSIALG